MSGTISMMEYDAPSASLLESFKLWSDDNFGSAAQAFKVLDDDGGGTISILEFKRGCRSLNWQGDASLLFSCLCSKDSTSDEGSKGGLTLKEVAFLDTWKASISATEKREIEANTVAKIEMSKPLCRQRAKRKAPGFSRKSPTLK